MCKVLAELFIKNLYLNVDNLPMGISKILNVILGVLSDWHVIVTVVVMLLVIEFAKFVANYKKRPPKPKVKKNKSAPKPKPKKEKKEGEGDDEDGERTAKS